MNYLNESIDQLHQNLVHQKLSAKELATNTLDNIKKQMTNSILLFH